MPDRPGPAGSRLRRAAVRGAGLTGVTLALLASPGAGASAGTAMGTAGGAAWLPTSPVSPPGVTVPVPATADGAVGGALLGQPGVVVSLPAGVPGPPKVEAQAYVVADADTGEVLAAKNAHERLRPASTLKTLTALTVWPELSASEVYRATQDDANVEGSKAGLVPGGTYTVDDLYNALFLRSGNDASTALARAAGGDVDETVSRMNAKAKRLGALDTTAVNPTGLDEDGQYSSAYDLALLGRAALREPGLRPYLRRTNASFPGRMPVDKEPRESFQLWTQQKFVRFYKGALGVKNGFTSKARFTGITAAERDGRTLIVTVMKSHNGYWQEAGALADWGFASAGRVQPVGALVEEAPAPAPVPPAAGLTVGGFGGVTAALPAVAAGNPAPWSRDAARLPLLVVGVASLTLAGGVVRARAARRAKPAPASPAAAAPGSETA